MYLNHIVIDRPKGTKLCPSGKNVYVYHVLESVYHPDKKYNTEKRTCIGKLQSGSKTKMIPNDQFIKYYPDLLTDLDSLPDPPQFSMTLHAGAVSAIRQVARDLGVRDILSDIYREKTAQEILSLISFILIDESAVFQHYDSFAREHLPENRKTRSDSYITSRILQREMTEDRMMEFLRRWNRLHCESEMVYIGCDSTNFNTEAEGVSLAEFGAAKDDPTKPQVNLAVTVDQRDSTPLHYDLFPGSIIDLTECEQMVEQLHAFGYRNIGMLFDRGYCSESNIRELDSMGYEFIMMLREDQKVVRERIKKHINEVKDCPDAFLSSSGVFGITVKDQLYDKERYFHIYYDDIKASYAKHRFLSYLDKMKSELSEREGRPLRKNANLKKYEPWFSLEIDSETSVLRSFSMRSKKVNERLNLTGFFVIMTTQPLTAEETLHIYRGRDNIEKFFRGIKSGMDFDSPGVHDDQTLAAKIHLIFLTGIIRNRFSIASRKIKKQTGNKKTYTVPMIIDQLEKIECTAFENGIYQRRYALTKGQKLILDTLQVDDKIIDAEIKQFNSIS